MRPRDGRIVKAVKPEGDKVMRFNARTATIENGFVHLPQEGSWLPDYLHEITTFPGSKYKDQADSTSQALAWINGMRTRPAIIEFQKRELAREMHNRGSSLEAIAARVDATPDEVEGWMNDYKEIAARVRARLEPQVAGRCKKCGGAVLFDVQCIEVGDEMYHTGCWRG